MVEKDEGREFLELRPFLEPLDPEYPDKENLVAGFKTRDGERWGVLVPVPPGAFQKYIRDYAIFTVSADTDGTLMPWPADPLDTMIDGDAMFEGNQLQKARIDDLTREMIELNRNERTDSEDNPVPGFMEFRAALGRAIALLDAEIARRQAE